MFRRRKDKLLFLILSILTAVPTVLIVIYYPPSFIFTLGRLYIPIIYAFLASLFLFIYFLGGVIFRNKAHGFLCSLFICVYLIFRLNNLTHPFFLLMLSALFITIELMVSLKK